MRCTVIKGLWHPLFLMNNNSTMILSDAQKCICEQIVIRFESELAGRRYGTVTTTDDGPLRVWQISYGRARSAEYGNLEELLTMYVNSNGLYSSAIKEFLGGLGAVPLANNATFIRLLQDAGANDPLMQKVQDQFFNWQYFKPAMRWMDANGFVLPLSALIIYDSFVQSDTVFKFLRKRIQEKMPCKGGNEKRWITQFVESRYNWLINYGSDHLQNDIYRTTFFRHEIARKNWMLKLSPSMACEAEDLGCFPYQ